MLEQVSNALPCAVQFTNGGTGATGLTVTVNVYRWNGSAWTQPISGASATEVGDGFYSYNLSSGNNTVEGLYLFVFITAGSADLKKVAAGWAVQKAGVENLDALISSRAASGFSVVVTSPTATDGTITIVQGDDYHSADGRSLDFTFSGAPSLTGSTPRISLTSPGATTPSLTVVGSVLSSTQLRFELTATQTNALTFATYYRYDIEATLTSGRKVTLQIGTATVREDYT